MNQTQQQNEGTMPEPKPERKKDLPDVVEETSEESFPASDAPSWTPVVGEQGPDPKQKKPAENPKERGCATSFIMDERGEIGGVCGDEQPDPAEQYVQPEKEKEAGGEGGT